MSIAINELAEAVNDVELLKEQNKNNLKLAQKQTEELELYKRKSEALKKVRITSACCLGTGLILIGAANFTGNNNLQKCLYVSGTALSVSGGLTLSFTILF